MPPPRRITDPVARKLAEWVILRSDNTTPSFQRYAAFVETNPSWPHSPLFRRRAENALWNDRLDDAIVRAFFAQDAADHRQGPLHAGARAARARRPRRRRRAGAPGLARGGFQRRCREARARDVRRHAHARRPQDAHGAALLCRRRRGRHARGRAARRQRSADCARPRRGDPQGRQRQGAARRGAGGRARRCRLYLRARALAAPKQQAGRSRQADPDRAEGSRRAGRSRPMVAGTPPAGAQAARRQRRADRLSRGARSRPADARQLPRRCAFHRRLDRAALPARSGHRRRAFRPDPEGTVNPHALGRGGYWQGRAAEAMGQRAQGQGVLRNGGAVHRHLLRPARARAAGA